MKRLKAITLGMLLLAMGSMQHLWAQDTKEMQTVPVQGWSASNISPDAVALFNKYAPKKDSIILQFGKFKERFTNRLSFHFNVLDWVLTMPGMGIELDLDQSSKNNRSVLLFGKGNWKTGHKVNPRLMFNMGAVRAEFRKYWRTGGIGTKNRNYEFEKLYISDGTLLKRDSIYYNPETFQNDTITIEYYTPEDSAKHAKFNGDPSKSRLYNAYLAFRRNVTSGRTLRNPRNWRAYYVGGYAGWDKYDIMLGKKGRKGMGLYAGVSLGWTIPLLTREHPNEGGLDLDLGGLLGVKLVKFDGYRSVSNYNTTTGEITREYVDDPSISKTKWSFVKWPVVQELRLSVVYRMRSVKHKVSLALVDEYNEKVEAMRRNAVEVRDSLERRKQELQTIRLENNRLARVAADSASYWDDWHRRRLENAKRINPDTIFSGKDDTLYQKIFRGIDLEHMSQKALGKYHDSIATAKKIADKLYLKQQDSIATAKRIADKKAKTDSLVSAKLAKKAEDSIAIANKIADKKAKKQQDSIAIANKIADKKKAAEDNVSDKKKAAEDKVADMKKAAEEKKQQAEEEKKRKAEEKKAAEEKKKQEAAEKKAKAEADKKAKAEAKAAAKSKKDESKTEE